MLTHMGLKNEAERLDVAIHKAIAEGKALTGDLGGKAKTTEYTKAIIDHLN